MINQDFCSSCEDGGPLLCCDDCPRSFHLRCLDPPLYQVPDGSWSCRKCSEKKGGVAPAPSQEQSAHFASLFARLHATNPKEFSPSPEIKDILASSIQEQKRPAKRSRKYVRECDVCKRELYGNMKNWVSCSRCIKSYHLYCLEPMLYEKPPRSWYCPDHTHRAHTNQPPTVSHRLMSGEEMYLLPEDAISMDFFPHSLLPTSTTRPTPRLNPTSLAEAQSNADYVEAYQPRANTASSVAADQLVSQLMGKQGARSVNEFLEYLENQQNRQVDQLRESTLSQAANQSNRTEATMARLFPLFHQFTAWQRLMQVNHSIHQIQSRGTPEDRNVWEELDRYHPSEELSDASEPSEEEEEEIEPPKKIPRTQRNQTVAQKPKPDTRKNNGRNSSRSRAPPPAAPAPAPAPVPTPRKRTKKSTMCNITVTISAEEMEEASVEIRGSKSVLIGRCDPNDPNSSLHLNLAEFLHTAPVRKVSHKHAEIQWTNNHYYLECLGRNGLHVDGQWIRKGQRILLQTGQVLRVGPFSLTFTLHE